MCNCFRGNPGCPVHKDEDMRYELPLRALHYLLLPTADELADETGSNATDTSPEARMKRIMLLRSRSFRFREQQLQWSPSVIEHATLSVDQVADWRAYFDGERCRFRRGEVAHGELAALEKYKPLIREFNIFESYFSHFTRYERHRRGVHDIGWLAFTDEEPAMPVCLARLARSIYAGSSSPPIRCMRAIVNASHLARIEQAQFVEHDRYGHLV